MGRKLVGDAGGGGGGGGGLMCQHVPVPSSLVVTAWRLTNPGPGCSKADYRSSTIKS